MAQGKIQLNFKDPATKWGWPVKAFGDLVLVLEGYPAFATVADGFIEDAAREAARDRSEWDSVQEFAQYVCRNYI